MRTRDIEKLRKIAGEIEMRCAKLIHYQIQLSQLKYGLMSIRYHPETKERIAVSEVGYWCCVSEMSCKRICIKEGKRGISKIIKGKIESQEKILNDLLIKLNRIIQ